MPAARPPWWDCRRRVRCRGGHGGSPPAAYGTRVVARASVVLTGGDLLHRVGADVADGRRVHVASKGERTPTGDLARPGDGAGEGATRGDLRGARHLGEHRRDPARPAPAARTVHAELPVGVVAPTPDLPVVEQDAAVGAAGRHLNGLRHTPSSAALTSSSAGAGSARESPRTAGAAGPTAAAGPGWTPRTGRRPRLLLVGAAAPPRSPRT